MINIKVDAVDGAAILHGNIEILRTVIEAEITRLTKTLVSVTKVEDFRFYQGVIQAHESTLKLLP